MSTRAALGLFLFLPCRWPIARRLSTSCRCRHGHRLGAHPTGADAVELAKNVRDWFGKDRAGRDNVAAGANPKIEGLDTAWAIDAPDAKTVAVIARTARQCRSRESATPDVRGHLPGRPWVCLSLDVPEGRQWPGTQGPARSLQRPPRARREPGVPKGKLTSKRPGRARSSPDTSATGGFTCPLNTRTTSPPA